LQLVATLPSSVYRIDAPPPRSSAEPAGADSTAGRTGRLLVVEDESLIALELCQGLVALGWEIVGPAATVDEALDMIEGPDGIDAAVLDVNLGGSLVYPLAERLQSLGVPFVFCTGYQHLDDHRNFAASPVVRKPVEIMHPDRELRRLSAAA
jgi:CheY-like chemotaxis protein